MLTIGSRGSAGQLVTIWPQAERMLGDAPELEAKALFAHFLEQPQSGLEPGHLRTFQRRVTHWRGTHGPDKEVYFPQRHCPGELMQLDWTHAKELGVTILGEPLDHLLCHCVLTHSNWEWAKRCQSESFLSLVSGLQATLSRLGKKPRHLGTDNSSAAIDHTVEKVEATMTAWMAGTRKWGAAEVRASLAPAPVVIPPVAELAPELDSYDQLLSGPEDSQEEVAYVG